MLNWNDILKFVKDGNPPAPRRLELTDAEWRGPCGARRDRLSRRPLARHDARRDDLQHLRRPSRARLPGRAAAQRAPVLHQRNGTERGRCCLTFG